VAKLQQQSIRAFVATKTKRAKHIAAFRPFRFMATEADMRRQTTVWCPASCVFPVAQNCISCNSLSNFEEMDRNPNQLPFVRPETYWFQLPIPHLM
jgi:hypothetical protein